MDYVSMKNEDPISMETAGCDGYFIHNVLETKDEPIPDGYTSFLQYWESQTGQPAPTKCQSDDPHKKHDGSDADKTELVGAHVRIDDFRCPNDWAWIVPLCKHCNDDDRTYCLWLPAGTKFVPIKMEKSHPTAKSVKDKLLKIIKTWLHNKGL